MKVIKTILIILLIPILIPLVGIHFVYTELA